MDYKIWLNDMDYKIWLNDKVLPLSEARVSIFDSSLMFGDMIFEMMRTFNHHPFKLREHLIRLYASARAMRIDIPYSIDYLEEAHYDMILKNNFDPDDEIRSLINVSRGTLSLYEDLDLPSGTQVMMAFFPLSMILRGKSGLYDTGVPAVITSQRTIPAQYLDPKVKNRSRVHYKMADIEAKRQNPDAWALLLDDDGYIAEGSGSNFFIVKNNMVITPEGRNCLRGISRQHVLDLCKNNRIAAILRNIDKYDIETADEAFFTCTPYSILPCTSINGLAIGDGKPGSNTGWLMEKWSESVSVDYVKQAKKWDVSIR